MSTEFREAMYGINQILDELDEDELYSREIDAVLSIRQILKGVLPSKEVQDMENALLGLKDKAAGKKLVQGELYDDPVWSAWIKLGETLSGGEWNSSSAIC